MIQSLGCQLVLCTLRSYFGNGQEEMSQHIAQEDLHNYFARGRKWVMLKRVKIIVTPRSTYCWRSANSSSPMGDFVKSLCRSLILRQNLISPPLIGSFLNPYRQGTLVYIKNFSGVSLSVESVLVRTPNRSVFTYTVNLAPPHPTSKINALLPLPGLSPIFLSKKIISYDARDN